MTGIPGKTGVVDILNREADELPSPNPGVAQNANHPHIDGATGVTENPR